ncbi:MAG: efflux RND transporter permease subunit [Betaproteobacteria bacterium]|nr:efflux RND transporter permease subunit [Betaproteobacteria bacterium]
MGAGKSAVPPDPAGGGHRRRRRRGAGGPARGREGRPRLLVDFVNLEVARGARFEDAIVRAGATRAKPIILTGVAAMLGALFILDDPIFNGLAVTLLFGILVSTLLTLVVIPVLYYAANWRRFQSRWR